MIFMTTRYYTKLIKVEKKPTLEELIEINKDYIKCLRMTGGQDAVDKYISHLKKLLCELPEKGSVIEIPMVELTNDGEVYNNNDESKKA